MIAPRSPVFTYQNLISQEASLVSEHASARVRRLRCSIVFIPRRISSA